MSTVVHADPLALIAQHRRRLRAISWAAIVVSFVHQAAALLLFSGDAPWDVAASLAMTAIVDLAIWSVGEYIYDLRAAGQRVGALVWSVFVAALLVSVGLNYSYLYTHRPAAEQLDPTIAGLIAAVFAVFVPAFIGVSGLMRGQLELWRASVARAGAAAQDAAQALREALDRVARLEQEIAAARAAAEQERAAGAQRSAETARLVGSAAQERDQLAQQAAETAQALREREQDVARLRQEIARLEGQARAASATSAQLDQARRAAEAVQAERDQARRAVEALERQLAEALESADLPALARALAGEGVAQRAIARALGKSDSTVRGWLARGAPAAA